MTNPIALDLLKLAEQYLSALHGSVARHDSIGLNLSCGGCALRDEIRDVLPKLAAAVSVPPPAPRADDQAALRDRIAKALAGTELKPPFPHCLAAADAVLAVLPEPADRAAALNEGADAVFALDYDAMVGEEGDENLGSMREAWDLGTIHAEKLLRRLADEERGEQQAQTNLDAVAEELAAAIASCPGYEMNPNPCRCPCEGCKHHCAAHNPDVSGPCVAGEQQNETPEAEPGCAHCGKTIRRITGTLAEWWVHEPGGHTICFPEQAASSPRATPKPVAGVRQDGASS